MGTAVLGAHDAGLLEDAIEAAEVGLQLLNKDLREASKTMGLNEVRHLINAYYVSQEHRIATKAQERSLDENQEPHLVLSWLGAQHHVLETQIKRVLDRWTDEHPVARWAKSITGIGPIIAAGLEAHIDITKCPTAGHIWSFAGLNPDSKWEKGQKRPWNAELKVITAFKSGESFVKVQNLDHDYYGKLFAQRRRAEDKKNEEGGFAETAAKIIAAKKFGKDTIALGEYKKGKLPKAHLHARARRYAVKMFLSHYHLVAYYDHYKMMPPKPFIFVSEPGRHVHYQAPPNLHLISGLQEAHDAYESELRKGNR